jgi:hypothetical protein
LVIGHWSLVIGHWEEKEKYSPLPLCPISLINRGICDFIKVKLNLIKIKKSLF